MKVLKKQRNSCSCLICGMDNPAGVKAMFYEMENGELYGLFKFSEKHQSYPGRVHGGMITAMLDELIGRVMWISEPDTLAVTTTMTVKFRRPVPINEQLKGVARLIQNSTRGYTGIGEIYSLDGQLLASCEGVYMKLPNSKIGDFNIHEEMAYYIKDDINEIE